jgi:hypothetical protein
MQTSAIACAAVLVLATGCFHAKEVADPSQEENAAQQGSEEEKAAQEEEKGTDSKDEKDSEKTDAPSEKKAAAQSAPSEKSAGSDKRSSGKEGVEGKDGDAEDAIDPEDIPVASSPQGLLKPGADDKVREKLGVSKGVGMRKALMKFQREHDLPATGMLDHETVEKLGFDPKDIFQKEG